MGDVVSFLTLVIFSYLLHHPPLTSRHQPLGHTLFNVECWCLKVDNMPTLYSKQPMITGWFLKVK